MMDSTMYQKTQKTFRSTNPCIMDSIDPTAVLENASGDNLVFSTKSDNPVTLETKLESLNIHAESLNESVSLSTKLLDENENLRISSAERFLTYLRIPQSVKKVKVVSIFGKTGDGKSYTLNKSFFDGLEVFNTSAEQSSCTLGVWAAFDPRLNVICLDTEGLLGVSKKEDQRTRLLLKVLAVSDIVIYRIKAERLQSDMYTFLGGASKAYKDHFQSALQQVWEKAEVDAPMSALGPSIIIFHETVHTNTLHCSASVSESPEDILRATFADLQLKIDSFSSLKYIGVRTQNSLTSFKELKNAIQLELEDTKVRSARHPKIVYHTLKGLNEKYSSELKNSPSELHLEQYFTCQERCQSCDVRCALSMGHKEAREAHYSPGRCRYQHQYQNCVYLCKKCNINGQRVLVKPSYQSISQNSWSSFINYVWSGYVIECKNCGEIYRSRQHWYGNKDPEDQAVITEIVHMWPGGEYFFQERNGITSQNSAQRVLDGVNMISDAVRSVSSQPTKVVTAWVTDKIAPAYWRPNHEIMHCHKCKTPFPPASAKHHCRSCGEGFCEACSSKKQPVPMRGWYTDVRVCDDCYLEIPPSLSLTTDDVEVRFRKYGEAVVSSITAVASVLEIPKGLIKDTVRPAYWMPDNECKNCICCGNPFGPVIPLHHCRDCGRGVCDDCSNTRKPVPYRGWDTAVRVCDICLKEN
ncbi:hypothetical protein PPYR_10670 [Photinus pyralis]|uniref:FYVE-type domain-containing protein n=1 Tax=Photinus pyralis TaxID=7054 RepID=A0A1Y1MQD2_PHOPY|nr:zinc finger FYVE domain-containing protein 1-like isoform X1 [Photinus pyralis]KAB0796609.1 hypothetical protein PPYR_10670 [Photinus pyralis]